MNPDTTLAICLLGPPALYGVIAAWEEYRQWAWERASRPRPVAPEDRPEWGEL